MDDSAISGRLLCEILDDMRDCHKTHNYSYLSGLIEEAQYRANRMEDRLGRIKDVARYERKRNELKDEISGLKDSLKPKEPEEEPPNKEEDPLAYVAWQNEKIVAPMAEQVEQLTAQVETMVQQRALGEAGAAVNASSSVAKFG